VLRVQEETEKSKQEGGEQNGHKDVAEVVNGPASTVRCGARKSKEVLIGHCNLSLLCTQLVTAMLCAP